MSDTPKPKQIATPTHWTDDRCDDYKLLEKLLFDCCSLNDGSGIIQRLERIQEAAEKLTNWPGERPDFLSWLKERLLDDRFPNREKR